MGSSLINVPNKPPPPQTGLLGAVAQHEQERKNAGGIGATITDREREKRVMVSVDNHSRVGGQELTML
jgi:CCR4-NOT transcriptional complex subunit CAF120